MVYLGGLVADFDDIVVVSGGKAEEVVEKAFEVVMREIQTRDEFRSGAGFNEVFNRYGSI